MKTYFYTDGNNKFGPFSVDQLRGHNITPETQVWCEGMTNWQPARTVYDLQSIIVYSAPPMQQGYSQQTTTQHGIPPKTWLVESILVTLLCCLPFGIIGIINASKVESQFYAGRSEQAEESSRNAKKWTIIGFWTGIVVLIVYVVSLFMVGFVDGL